MTKQIQHKAILKSKEQVSPDSFILTFHCPSLAGNFEPGQFMEIDCGGYICRPFAIMAQNSLQQEIKVGVQVVGPSTKRLTSYPIDQEVKIIGPLGHGYRLEGYQEIIAVGGSSGIFPMYEALRQAQENGAKTSLICGFPTEDAAYPKEIFRDLDAEIFYSSDQGGLDFTGHAGSCLSHYFSGVGARDDLLLIGCGPGPMLAYLKEFAREKAIACQISLEENMACGLGLCTGCVVDIINENNEIERVRCCVEGPVFDSRRVIFED